MKLFLPLALIAFLFATVGADIYARVSIGGEPWLGALKDHFYWAWVQLVGTLFLLVPFAAVGLICGVVDKKAQRRSAAVVFGLAMLPLIHFYFQGHIETQYAIQDEKWTAAALSVGLLPILIGVPVMLLAFGAGWLAVRFDRRSAG